MDAGKGRKQERKLYENLQWFCNWADGNQPAKWLPDCAATYAIEVAIESLSTIMDIF
jgi:hypothetical protein